MAKSNRANSCAQQLDDQKNIFYTDNFVKPKKTLLKFSIFELLIYIVQIIILLSGIAVMSNFLHDEERLTHLISVKVHPLWGWELIATILVVFTIVGLLFFTKRFFKNSNEVEEIIIDVLNEIPRVIYFFGSSTVACLLAIYGFKIVNPNLANSIQQTDIQLLSMSGLFALEMFIIGCVMSIAMKWKTHIL